MHSELPEVPQPVHQKLKLAISAAVSKVENESVRQADGNKHLYKSSESNVEGHLVRPILEALDWNLAERDQVETQYWSVSDDRPDFALRRNGVYTFVVEAKALGNADPAKHIQQLHTYLRYCPHVVLTDGMKWNLFDTEHGFDPRHPIWSTDLRSHRIEYSSTLLASFYRDSNNPIKLVASSAAWASSFQANLMYDALEAVVKELDVIGSLKSTIVRQVKHHVAKRHDHNIAYDDAEVFLSIESYEYLQELLASKLQDCGE
jgi:hypothetical protein